MLYEATRGVSEAEAASRRHGDATAGEVGAHVPVLQERALAVRDGRLDDCQGGGIESGGRWPCREADDVRRKYRKPLRELRGGLPKRRAAEPCNEVDDVAARAAAETVVDLFFPVGGERGGFFLMEGAQALEISTGGLERNVIGDDLNDVRPASDLFENVLRNE